LYLDKKHDRAILYRMGVTKGETTRATIAEHAVRLAARVGLEGLSVGQLASELRLSKSGLFAHFGSKENLQVETIKTARELFVAEVLQPALTQPRGEPRIRAMFERWLAWCESPGGCFFVAAAVELDDRPGPARDALMQAQRDWLDALATAARIAVEARHFRRGLDTQQFAFELYSLMLGHHHFQRFLHDPRALPRTRRAFEALLEQSR
jgi:AcrR family transcriptional regulator